jgi:hypothetical protein
MNKRVRNKCKPEARAVDRERRSVEPPGVVRTFHPDGSYSVVGPSGDHYQVSALGNIEGDVPSILRVRIEDLALVIRHDIVPLYQTVSHTLHFVGGGVFSYLHWHRGTGITVRSRNVMCCKTADGILIVYGTATANL